MPVPVATSYQVGHTALYPVELLPRRKAHAQVARAHPPCNFPVKSIFRKSNKTAGNGGPFFRHMHTLIDEPSAKFQETDFTAVKKNFEGLCTNAPNTPPLRHRKKSKV